MTASDRRKGIGARQPARRARSLAVLLVALIAFSWQSFATQTHVHDPARVATAAAVAGSPVARSGGQPSDLPANCLLCSELAHAGTYLASAPVTLALPGATAFWVAPAVERRLALLRRAQGWRSRAPPVLQA